MSSQYELHLVLPAEYGEIREQMDHDYTSYVNNALDAIISINITETNETLKILNIKKNNNNKYTVYVGDVNSGTTGWNYQHTLPNEQEIIFQALLTDMNDGSQREEVKIKRTNGSGFFATLHVVDGDTNAGDGDTNAGDGAGSDNTGSGSSVICTGDGVYNITKNGSITCS